MKRRVLTILLFLLLGAVVNVAVAWGLAVSPNDGYPLSHRVGATQINEDAAWEVEHYVWRGRAEYRSGLFPVDLVFDAWPNTLPVESVLPYWSGIPHPSMRQKDPSDWYDDPCRCEIGCGWPMLCMKGSIAIDLATPDPEPTTTSGAIDLGGEDRVMQPGESRLLPLCPIWPGFAANTVLYAVDPWILFCGPFVLRRYVRRRRGRCVKCGYDLRGEFDAGCPECGWNREAAEP